MTAPSSTKNRTHMWDRKSSSWPKAAAKRARKVADPSPAIAVSCLIEGIPNARCALVSDPPLKQSAATFPPCGGAVL
ncbi:hypothetical protein GCM10007937_39860 [Mesorhizobium albiziae]|nr:hypothetical protein GCM10007937_39860 [Mesorhizobium albiziae]